MTESCVTRYSTIAPERDLGTVWTGRVTGSACRTYVNDVLVLPALELVRVLEEIMPAEIVVQKESEVVRKNK